MFYTEKIFCSLRGKKNTKNTRVKDTDKMCLTQSNDTSVLKRPDEKVRTSYSCSVIIRYKWRKGNIPQPLCLASPG